MAPLTILIEQTDNGDTITRFVQETRLFGITIYRKVFINATKQEKQRTSGFNVFPDQRQYVEEEEEYIDEEASKTKKVKNL